MSLLRLVCAGWEILGASIGVVVGGGIFGEVDLSFYLNIPRISCHLRFNKVGLIPFLGIVHCDGC